MQGWWRFTILDVTVFMLKTELSYAHVTVCQKSHCQQVTCHGNYTLYTTCTTIPMEIDLSQSTLKKHISRDHAHENRALIKKRTKSVPRLFGRGSVQILVSRRHLFDPQVFKCKGDVVTKLASA